MDNSLEIMMQLKESEGNVRVIKHRRNFGKAVALKTGFAAAKGEISITMDGDLQDNPAEIPRFIEEIIPILSDKKVVFVLNECANIEKLPFKVVKDFRIGSNCFIDNYGIIEEIKNYITENDIIDHVFLSVSYTHLRAHET